MFERFTERARQVVVLAQDEARALRDDHIGTEHLLLGLMREEPGVAARVLGEAGLDVDVVRDRLRAIVGERDDPSPGAIPFSPGAKAALEAALRESLDVGHNFIGTEHILLGILRNPEPQVSAVLAAAGGDVDELVASAEQALPGRSIVEIAPDIMGFERLTEFARGAIVFAQDEARSLNHNYVGTEHVLLGLLREEHGGAARALSAVGIRSDAARDQVRRTVGAGDLPVVGQIPFTPHARRILALAREEASALNHWSVGTEHLLLGLIEGTAVWRPRSSSSSAPTRPASATRCTGCSPSWSSNGRSGRRRSPFLPRLRRQPRRVPDRYGARGRVRIATTTTRSARRAAGGTGFGSKST